MEPEKAPQNPHPQQDARQPSASQHPAPAEVQPRPLDKLLAQTRDQYLRNFTADEGVDVVPPAITEAISQLLDTSTRQQALMKLARV